MMFVRTNVIIVEQATQMAVSSISISGRVPVASSLSRRLSKISKWVWPRLLLYYCLCSGPWIMRDFACPLRAESLLPVVLSSPGHKLCWFSKPDILGDYFPSAAPLGFGAQCWAQTPHSLGRTSTIVLFFCLWVANPEVWVLTIDHLHLSYPSYCGSFFMSLVWKIISASLQVVLRDSC